MESNSDPLISVLLFTCLSVPALYYMYFNKVAGVDYEKYMPPSWKRGEFF